MQLGLFDQDQLTADEVRLLCCLLDAHATRACLDATPGEDDDIDTVQVDWSGHDAARALSAKLKRFLYG